MAKYRVEYMQKTYWDIYRDFAESMKLEWNEAPVVVPEVKMEEPEASEQNHEE